MTGKTIFTLQRTAVMRGFVMNHLIHHRAQLGVYLRLLDVPYRQFMDHQPMKADFSGTDFSLRFLVLPLEVDGTNN